MDKQELRKYAEEVAEILNGLLNKESGRSRASVAELEYNGKTTVGIEVEMAGGTGFDVAVAGALENGAAPEQAAETIRRLAAFTSAAGAGGNPALAPHGHPEERKPYILSHVQIRLMPQGEPGVSLPHVRYLDLDGVFVVADTDDGFSFQMPVTKEIMTGCGLTTNELFTAAMENMSFLLVPERVPLPGKTFFPRRMTAFTAGTETGAFGASVILNKDALRKVAEVFRDDVIILPFSIHSAGLFPYSGYRDAGPEVMEEALAALYDECPEEFRLTRSVYRFSSKTGRTDILHSSVHI